jgi:phosphoribosylanthranilate isomerase
MKRHDSPASHESSPSGDFIVKVCGITRREDAFAAAQAGATAIGFVFYPKSPRFVAPETAAALGEGLPLWKVGVFVNEPPAMIAAVMSAALLDVAQIYGGEPPPSARVWKAFRLENSFDRSLIDASSIEAEAVLLDGISNGNSFDWSIARDLKKSHPAAKVIVAGGLNASNVAEAIRTARPWGVDASSSLESSPGVKDREKVRRFVEAARTAAARESLGQEIRPQDSKELS